MVNQIVVQFDNFGVNRATDQISDWLAAHPTYRVANIYQTTIAFVGSQAPGVMVVFERPEPPVDIDRVITDFAMDRTEDYGDHLSMSRADMQRFARMVIKS